MTDSINSIGSTLSRLQGLYPQGSSNLPGKTGVGQTLKASPDTFGGSAAEVELSSGDLLETGNFGIIRVQESLTQTVSKLDKARAAAEQTEIQLEKLAELAEAASYEGLDDEARNAIEAKFTDTIKLIDNLTDRAAYAGQNLLQGDDLFALATPVGGQVLKVEGADLSSGGEVITVQATQGVGDPEAAGAAADAVRQSINNVQKVRSSLEQSAAELEVEQDRAAILIGGAGESDLPAIAGLADASGASDLAVQIGQALGFSGQAIANNAPGSVITLFRE